ncbi:MAG: sigma-70 family RNA polymerase sigma factor [Bacteroidales bacterium]|jgi:RNA polymerase sigma-70 factor (ECF subfamily)|nr:sigma-70 family RNA polymerase sigma factor [Bacteroidales bacterium]
MYSLEYMLSEEELIHKCIVGDRIAQKELYEKYNSMFYALCLRYMPSEEDAEDVLVMGFTSIFSKLETFEGKGSFEGWMRRIIINTALTTLRINSKHYRMRSESESESEKNILSENKNTIYSKLNVKDILNQIQQMPTGYRIVFNLYAIEGYSYEEIAEIMGISKNTVRSQLSKARKMLQKKLQIFR